MSMRREGYYYNQQLTNFIRQFMAVFTDLQVKVGKNAEQDERLISVPITYAHRDRVAAAIAAGNTQNTPIRLPIMSAFMRNVDISMSRAHGVGQERRNSYVPVGGLIPDDIKVIKQRMPVPYDMSLELNIWASNTDQHHQMLEQILPYFDPSIELHSSTGVFDWTRMHKLELKSVNTDNNYPIGQDRRIITSTLNFEMPIHLDTPADLRTEFVNKIFMRIGTVGTGANTNEEMVADLDSQGIPYELWQDASDVKI